jgi:FtsZ-binding cell division protein ZapB
MTTIPEIQAEIERLSEQRTDLYTELSRGRSETVRQEIKQIDERLQGLWDAHRAERARIRFGEREDIVRRARAEDRLDRAA